MGKLECTTTDFWRSPGEEEVVLVATEAGRAEDGRAALTELVLAFQRALNPAHQIAEIHHRRSELARRGHLNHFRMRGRCVRNGTVAEVFPRREDLNARSLADDVDVEGQASTPGVGGRLQFLLKLGKVERQF